MSIKKVILANPRGFCAGVVRAVDIVEKALELLSPPIYVFHEIVHNGHVVQDLKSRGVIFVDAISEVPPKSVCIFSAHGISPQVRNEARERNLRVVDATCPLVTKVHLEALRFARDGYSIVLIGHPGHEEVEGTMGEARMQLVSSVEDVRRLQVPDPERVAVLTQTTLSLDDTAQILKALQEKFPALEAPRKDDICYATQNRQNAMKKMAAMVDLVLVIGSQNSSNSQRLKEVAQATGVKAYLINDEREIDPDWLQEVERVGITAGASAPEQCVQRVISYFNESEAVSVEELDAQPENVRFSVPAELLRLAETARS